MSAPATDRRAKAATRGALTRKPKANFETWSWYFMRVSGLILMFLALTHFAITHIINDVVETDAEFVAERWDNPLWRLFDWALLARLAQVHARLCLAIANAPEPPRWISGDFFGQKFGSR